VKILTGVVLNLTILSAMSAQDVMLYGVKHLKVLAEDSRVRVLRFAPSKGDKTPMHSHPDVVAYVVKGGKIRLISPDGTSTIAELKSGETALRPPVTHSDEALDDLEVILVELKK
jgi:quercetin dioxygenase-like cupin family protein